jgi:hypothetical protein
MDCFSALTFQHHSERMKIQEASLLPAAVAIYMNLWPLCSYTQVVEVVGSLHPAHSSLCILPLQRQ